MIEPRQKTAYPLRIPPELREQLGEAAIKNQRSLNAEISIRLEETFKIEKSLKAVAADEPVTGAPSLSSETSADRVEQHIKQTETNLASIRAQITSILEMLQAQNLD